MDMRAGKLEEVVFCFALEQGKKNVFWGGLSATLGLANRAFKVDDDYYCQNCPDLLLTQGCNAGDDQPGSNGMLLLEDAGY